MVLVEEMGESEPSSLPYFWGVLGAHGTHQRQNCCKLQGVLTPPHRPPRSSPARPATGHPGRTWGSPAHPPPSLGPWEMQA